MKKINKKPTPFLFDYQMEAVQNMKDGCILNGGVGSGKSRTSLYYYFQSQGGKIEPGKYTPMKEKPLDLYIITTARKRDTLEWESELVPFMMTSFSDHTHLYDHTVVIDSWNNIKKYEDVTNAFFIFDEQRVIGHGTWVKAFLKIAKNNRWILLSATPGDSWSDYIPVFIANGFYKNKTEFNYEHVVFSRFSKYPKVDRYINIKRLIRQRNDILINMNSNRNFVESHIEISCPFDREKYKEAMKNRWDPFKNLPMQQASDLCYVLRRIVNESEMRVVALLEILEKVDRAIIFYSFDYEREILLNLDVGYEIREWNGHKHQEIPDCDRWLYLVQYAAGNEGWNCIKTDTIIFYSQTYSYKVLKQACGRIKRLNSPYDELFYYHLKSNSNIDLAIGRSLKDKKNFNEGNFVKWK